VLKTVAAGEMHRLGHKFNLLENKVWLTDFVPAGFIRTN
jgi:putative RNA 2'-phosphotransferase